MKVVAIIQARFGSTRLPGKVLTDMAGQPMLGRVVDRVLQAHSLHEIIVATSVRPENDAICDYVESLGIKAFQGSEEDVLDRYYRCANLYRADHIVRITGDCPLLDPHVLDHVVEQHLMASADYTSNIFPVRSYPRGLDVEVFKFKVLERLWQAAKSGYEREHVTPYIHRHPGLFFIHSITNPDDYSQLQWSVDTLEDFAFAERVYRYFGYYNFAWEDIIHEEERIKWKRLNYDLSKKNT